MRAARELLKGLEYEVLSGSVDINVNELVYNTAKVTKACLFVCIKGMAFDSHEAAAKAAAILTPKAKATAKYSSFAAVL